MLALAAGLDLHTYKCVMRGPGTDDLQQVHE